MAEHYHIRVRGRLDDRWSTWFHGLRLTAVEDGTTSLVGPIVDQAALHGLLATIRDLGLPLLSVVALGSGQVVDQYPGRAESDSTE